MNGGSRRSIASPESDRLATDRRARTSPGRASTFYSSLGLNTIRAWPQMITVSIPSLRVARVRDAVEAFRRNQTGSTAAASGNQVE
jgi:hypothetical protein